MSETLYYAPGAAMRLETYAWSTTQVGTIGVRLRSLTDRSDTIARTTAGIAFDAATGAHWIDTLTAPLTAADYDAIWDIGGALPWPSQRVTVTGSSISPIIGGGRTSMAALISRVRSLANDQPGASQVFSDAEVQQFLDDQRINVRYLELTPEWQTTGQVTQWFNYYDELYGGNWETDAVFTSRSWATITPDVADWQTGKWTWNASQLPPVFISGRTYDPFSAAADMLEEWAAKVSLDFDVSTGRSNLTATRSQKQAMLLAAADRLRARGRSSAIEVERSDT